MHFIRYILNSTFYILPIIALIFLLVAIAILPASEPPTTQAQQQQQGTGISITIEGEAPPPEEPLAGGGGIIILPSPATVIFKGYAYPGALVTFVKNGAIIGNTLSKSNGMFEKEVDTDPGISTFGIWAKDRLGLNSSTTNVSIALQEGAKTTIANIVLSPTIAAHRSVITQGEKLTIYGSATPDSNVRLFNNYSPGQVLPPIKTKSNGRWEYILDTLELQPGEYSLKANAQLEALELLSPFSSNLLFSIEEKKCFGSDLNNDGRVNVADFSIMMFYWNKSLDEMKTKPVNRCADVDGDGFIGLIDFSIMMYRWTG